MDLFNKFIILWGKKRGKIVFGILALISICIVFNLIEVLIKDNLYYIMGYTFLGLLVIIGLIKLLKWLIPNDNEGYDKTVKRIKLEIKKQLNRQKTKEEKLDFLKNEKEKYKLLKENNNIAPAGIIISLLSILSAILIKIIGTDNTPSSEPAKKLYLGLSEIELWFLAITILTIIIGLMISKNIHDNTNYAIRLNIIENKEELIKENNQEELKKENNQEEKSTQETKKYKWMFKKMVEYLQDQGINELIEPNNEEKIIIQSREYYKNNKFTESELKLKLIKLENHKLSINESMFLNYYGILASIVLACIAIYASVCITDEMKHNLLGQIPIVGICYIIIIGLIAGIDYYRYLTNQIKMIALNTHKSVIEEHLSRDTNNIKPKNVVEANTLVESSSMSKDEK